MSTFHFLYHAEGGNSRKGAIRATNMTEARRLLSNKGITPITIKEDKRTWWEQIVQGNADVKEEDIVSFTQLFAGTLKVGMSIKDSLTILHKQVEHPRMQRAIGDLLQDLNGGAPLSVAFMKHLDIFPEYYPMLVKAGEASGDIAGVFEYIANYMERLATIKKEIYGIFTYPIVLGSMAFILLMAILFFVAPRFKGVFATVKASSLPIPTKMLFWASDMVIHNSIPMLILIGTAVGGIYFGRQTPKGREMFDTYMLSVPIFGQIIRQILVLRMVRGLDILINNKVPILQSLKVVEDSISNVVLKEILITMRRDISRGLPLSNALIANKHIISPIVSYTISMGEKSGNLGHSFSSISLYLDKEIGYNVKKVASKLDPMITGGMGIMVLYVVISIYLPIFDMMGKVAK